MLQSPVYAFVPREAQSLWGRLTRIQRLALGAVALGGLGLLIAVLVTGRPPDLAPVFTDLKDDEAAAIVAKLKEKGIAYDVAERGVIKVPRGQVQEVRLMMAGLGLPKKGSAVGFEMFNQPQLGMTEFAEKINYQRAIEGELGRTIERIEAVDSARVHVVMPQPSLFTSQQKEATASVVLALKPATRLDSAQIQGITQLVAGSIEGMKAQNVTIVDAGGNVLSDRQADSDPARLTNTRSAVKEAIENRVASEVRTMLAQVLGSERSIVRVSADLDWDQYESASETFSPGQRQPQIRSQRQIVESNQTGSTAGGVPGTESNVPTYPAQAGGSTGAQGERRDTLTNFELSKLSEKSVRAPGAVKRLSVAVALDSDAISDATQADAITKLVATAAGLDVNRGDVVTLTSLPFNGVPARPPVEVAKAAKERELLLTYARLAALIVGPLLVAFVIWLVMRRPKPRRGKGTPPDATITEIGARDAAVQALADQQVAMPELPPVDAAAVREAKRVQTELTNMARTDPGAMAQLVRTLMQEDRRGSS